MHQFSKYILLFAVIAGQLFSSTANLTARCADVGCQCSVQSKAEGSCCCSSNESNEVDSCCARKKATSCCTSNAGVRGDTRAELTVCLCGCQHSTRQVPAQSESDSSEELLRLVVDAFATSPPEAVSAPRTLDPAPQRPTFYGGLSTQPLYCSWVI
jgi:hypothetical protein